PDGLTVNAQRNGHRAYDITISAPDSSLRRGQHVQATAKVKDQHGKEVAHAKVRWAATSLDVASVSDSGMITGGTATGTATISATADGVTRTMDVTVAPATDAADTTSTTSDSATTKPGVAVHMVS